MKLSASGTENRRMSNERQQGRITGEPRELELVMVTEAEDAQSHLDSRTRSQRQIQIYLNQFAKTAPPQHCPFPKNPSWHFWTKSVLWFPQGASLSHRALKLSIKKHHCWKHYPKSLKDSIPIGLCHVINSQWEGTSLTFLIIIYE